MKSLFFVGSNGWNYYETISRYSSMPIPVFFLFLVSSPIAQTIPRATVYKSVRTSSRVTIFSTRVLLFFCCFFQIVYFSLIFSFYSTLYVYTSGHVHFYWKCAQGDDNATPLGGVRDLWENRLIHQPNSSSSLLLCFVSIVTSQHVERRFYNTHKKEKKKKEHSMGCVESYATRILSHLQTPVCTIDKPTTIKLD